MFLYYRVMDLALMRLRYYIRLDLALNRVV